MLSKKFFSDGEIPGPAASATSGIIIDAVKAAAVKPVTAFSFNEAFTWNPIPDFDPDITFEGFMGKGLKNPFEFESRFWLTVVKGTEAITAEVEAISCISLSW